MRIRIAWRAKLARTLVVLLALSAIASPVAALEHSLEHLEHASDAAGTLGDPDGRSADAEVECDLCGILANGRAAVVLDLAPSSYRIEVHEPIDPVASWHLPRSPTRGPDSQRAPPLS